VKKSISTDQTPENIARILEILAATPDRLEALVGPGSGVDPAQPIGPGERSPLEVLAHLIYTESLAADHIHLALMVAEPRLVVVHAQRDIAKLLRYEGLFDVPEMLAYIRFRRKGLMPVLRGLKDKQWSRTADKGIKRMESVYWAARGLALHEEEHLRDLEAKL
jgi:hypothetical protein